MFALDQAIQKEHIMLSFIKRFFYKNQTGASGVEYALVVGLATLAIVAGTVGLSGVIESNYDTVTQAVDQAN